MEVIGKERPSVDGECTRLSKAGEAPDEIVLVVLIAEDDLPVQPSPHHMVEDPRGIKAGGAGHSGRENIIK